MSVGQGGLRRGGNKGCPLDQQREPVLQMMRLHPVSLSCPSWQSLHAHQDDPCIHLPSFQIPGSSLAPSRPRWSFLITLSMAWSLGTWCREGWIQRRLWVPGYPQNCLQDMLETPQPRYPTSDRIFLGFSIPEYSTIHGTASQKPFFSGSLALPHPHVQQFDRFPEDFWGLPTVSVFTAITLD